MKKIILFFLFTNILLAQTPNAVMQDRMNFEPGELIVKLKDEVNTKVYYAKSGKAKSDFNIGALLGIEDKLASYEVLFHQKSIEASIVNQQKMKAKYAAKKAQNSKNGYQPKEPLTLKNIFVVKTNDKQEDIMQLIELIKDDPNVEYAEPNYNFSINDFEITSDIIYDKNIPNLSASNSTVPNDPLYSQQTNITQTNIDDVWNEYTTGDGSQVVAILDTGVDYTHPDLEANIWINEAELNGVEGYDDDGNGYVDDIRGWDFINNDNTPLDDNMHGTHVAGIVGAVGGNGIGVAGAAWNVKLMPIKVFQSNGVGNSTTIAEGVNYATANGATIQNMSFGSYAESATLKSVLDNAYASSFLVAAAGNNGICIGPGLCPNKRPGGPLYPGAYTFVLATQDFPQYPSPNAYTNYDQDGPIYSGYANFLNYEVTAPGSAIMSTVPNGGYRALTGTSMASPLVAGAMALYLQQKPDESKELIFGNLINTSDQNVDIKAAIDVVPTPVLKVLSADIKDEINDQNNNGLWEPGETLELFPMIKNYWGPTDDVRVGIEFWEFEDTTKAEFLNSEIAIGSISAYANLKDFNQSLKIKLADNITNNVNIQFKVSVWSGNDQDYLSSHKIVVNTTEGNLITGHYTDQTLTLEENHYYIVTGVCVLENTKIVIKPGVTLEFDKDMTFMMLGSSHWVANGSKENRITIKSSDGLGFPRIPIGSRYPPQFNFAEYKKNVDDPMSGYQYDLENQNSLNGTGNFPRTLSVYEYCDFENVDTYPVNGTNVSSIALFKNCNFRGDNNIFSGFIYKSTIENPGSFSGNQYNWNGVISGGAIGNCVGCAWDNGSSPSTVQMKTYNTIVGDIPGYLLNTSQGYGGKQHSNNNIIKGEKFGNNIYELNGVKAHLIDQTFGFKNNDPPIYSPFMGPSTIKMFKEINKDIFTGGNTGIFDWDNSAVKLSPYEEAHGFVWKITINGFNAFDDYIEMDPVGVGSHEFKVYFNREMDTSVDPQISYGVREPYNQKIISEQGTWSTDGKIYTVTHDVNIGAADGINRIRVQDARDLDYFEIPVEDYRFNMLVQSAGSASTGFMATAGLGEITLDWTAPSASDLNDVLGYNMYRYTTNEDGTFTDPVKINQSLVTDVSFKDFDVSRETQYFYKYKILRTSFEETDYSNAVYSQLLTASLGDSNGDSGVNVMDVVNTVDYILGNNPTPFVDYATDVNNDSSVNVLDIVGIVDMILNPTASKVATKGAGSIDYYSNIPVGDATFYWENDDLYVESEYDITGLQLAFHKNFTYSIADNLPQFEWLNYDQDSTKVTMMYSFGNLKLLAGKTKILTKTNPEEVTFNIDKAEVATVKGGKLNPLYKSKSVLGIDAPDQGNVTKIFTIGPNPTSGILNVFYYLPEQMDKVRMTAYDIQGKSVWVKDSFKNTSGQTNTSVDISSLNNGIYFLVIDVVQSNQIQKREVKRIIMQK
jgi:subtilisin family serine protease